jgi:hypothetical protein
MSTAEGVFEALDQAIGAGDVLGKDSQRSFILGEGGQIPFSDAPALERAFRFVWETRLGPVAAVRREAMRAYSRRTREMDCVAERESERAVVVLIGGTTQPARSEGPALHRCTRRMRGASDECRKIG